MIHLLVRAGPEFISYNLLNGLLQGSKRAGWLH